MAGRRTGDSQQDGWLTARRRYQTCPVVVCEQRAWLPRCSPLWCPEEQATTDAVHPWLSLCPVAPWNGAGGRGEPTEPSAHPLKTWHHLAPLLAPSQSISARQRTGGDGQQLGDRDFAQCPEHPCKGSPQDGLGHPRPVPSPLFPLEMDSMGFRERRQCGQGDREKRSRTRSLRACPAQALDSFSLG